MSSPLKLDEMSTREKLQALEMLWDDLCRHAEVIASPEWHGKLLAAREARVHQGQEARLDWEKAKQRIRSSVL